MRPPAEPRARRLPPDWKPSEADRGYAVGLGLDAARVDRIEEDFRGYWLSRGGDGARKLDWGLTWKSWCRREADREPKLAAAAKPVVKFRTFDEVMESARKRLAENSADRLL